VFRPGAGCRPGRFGDGTQGAASARQLPTSPRSATARGPAGPTIGAMSTSDAAYEWDLTVPGDDAELAGEFRRHGIQPGQRVHVAVVANGDDGDATGEALPTFFGSFDGPADLAEGSSEILRAEFPNGR
jgi:hypothetical protein